MALKKGKVFLREALHGDEKIIEGYVSNVDQIGVMINSQSDNQGVLTVYPISNIYKVEISEPMVRANAGLVLPRHQ